MLTVAILFASGCSSVQWNDAGRQLSASAAEQLFTLAFGGNDGFENLTDDQFERRRLDDDRFDSLSRESMIESDRMAEQWERYDDIVSKQLIDTGDELIH